MKSLLICLFLFQVIFASQNEWENFKVTYKKAYESEDEDSFRKQIFLKNLERIEANNKRYEEGLSTYFMAINKFADLTKEELPSSRISKDRVTYVTHVGTSKSKTFGTGEVPESIDWRDYGVIQRVRDQLYCNTCWAFAVVGTIEAHMGIYRNVTVSLSEQNLADCVDSTFSCQSDMKRDIIERTYQYIIDNDGIDTLDSYIYEMVTVGSCRFNNETVGATIKGYANVTEADEEELKAVVGTIGPVTVAITTNLNFDLYGGGVFYDPNCMNEGLIFNHAVVIVGYGTEDGQDYWLVRNSWGAWFGEEGYIKMTRNRDNNCGIASIARYPLM